MTYASHTGLLVWVVIASIVWVFKFMQRAVEEMKRKEQAGSSTTTERSGRETMRKEAQQVEARDSEEERTRKFMEALGLPAQGAGHRAPAASTVLRPTTARSRPGGGALPVPPIIAPTALGRRGAESMRRSQPHPPGLPAERRRLEHATMAPIRPETPSGAGQFHLPDLQMPESPVFHTRSSEVSAIPVAERWTYQDEAVPVDVGHPAAHELLRLIRSPEGLRSAVILSEILGPPRSLQSFGAAGRVGVPL